MDYWQSLGKYPLSVGSYTISVRIVDNGAPPYQVRLKTEDYEIATYTGDIRVKLELSKSETVILEVFGADPEHLVWMILS